MTVEHRFVPFYIDIGHDKTHAKRLKQGSPK